MASSRSNSPTRNRPATAPASLVVPMPIAGTQDAPKFNGKFATDFLNTIVLHGKQAGITDKNLLVDYIYHYSSDEIKSHIRFLPEFDIEVENKTWDAALNQLKSMFAYDDTMAVVVEEDLAKFHRAHSENGSFSSQKDVEAYYLAFQKIAAPLVKAGDITTKKRDLAFVKGIPKSLRDWFTSAVPEANRTKDNPPALAESRKVLLTRYDRKSLFYDSAELSDDRNTSYDDEGNRLDASKARTLTSAVTPNRPRVATQESIDVDALTKALQDFHIDQATVSKLVSIAKSSGSHNTDTTNGYQPNPNKAFASINRSRNNRSCIICGKSENFDLDHPLGIPRCPETAALVASGDMVYNNERRRYTTPDGQDLPYAGPGVGVASILRARRRGTATGDRDTPPHVPSSNTNTVRFASTTSNVKLDFGTVNLGHNGVFGVNLSTLNTDPALRSGKDTSNRHDPIRKPQEKSEKAKGKERQVDPPQAGPSNPKPAPTQQDKVNIPPPPNPINREDGWQDSIPSRRKNQEQDIQMRDDQRDKRTPGFHSTSDIQDKTDIQAIMNECLHQVVPIKFGVLVGASPKLQSAFVDAFRTRRVPNNHVEAESLSSSINFSSVPGRNHTFSERLMVSNPEPRELERFVTNYAAKAIKVPDEKYLAMTCGFLKIEIDGKMYKALIDTGSELNIAGTHVDEETGLPLDFVGMHWSLKGVHGKAERLKGLIVDVPIRIGSRDFPAHVFVSRFDIGDQDLILGQPFFHWYTAQIDFARSGKVMLYLWEDGDRDHDASISIMIADPESKRNITKISHTARIEEVPDEEDF